MIVYLLTINKRFGKIIYKKNYLKITVRFEIQCCLTAKKSVYKFHFTFSKKKTASFNYPKSLIATSAQSFFFILKPKKRAG